MASKSILQIVRAVAPRLGITAPSTATGSTDLQVQQLLALANEEGQELAGRHPWTALINETTFTSVAQEDQGAISGQRFTALPLLGSIVATASGFSYILNDTIFNRSTRNRLGGPVSPSKWQSLQGTAMTSSYSEYRLRGNRLLLYPAPASDLETLAFEYITENWVTNVGGDEFRSEFTADDDYPLLDSKLIQIGLTWRWKQAKGLSYSQDFEKYEMAVMDAKARDGTGSTVSLDGCNRNEIEPGVFVSRSSWGL